MRDKLKELLQNMRNEADDTVNAASYAMSTMREIEGYADTILDYIAELEDEMQSIGDESVPDEMLELIERREGFTYSVSDAEFITGGESYAVAVDGESVKLASAVMRDKGITHSIIQALCKRYKRIGGWYNKDSGEYELESVILHDDIIQAYQQMVRDGQLALYDFSIGEVVTLSTLYTIAEELSFNDEDRARQLYAEYQDMVRNKKAKR
jgi:hypothetical protein